MSESICYLSLTQQSQGESGVQGKRQSAKKRGIEKQARRHYDDDDAKHQAPEANNFVKFTGLTHTVRDLREPTFLSLILRSD